MMRDKTSIVVLHVGSHYQRGEDYLFHIMQKMKKVSLDDLVALREYPTLSEEYVSYLQYGDVEKKEYRHQEIEGIRALISYASLEGESLWNFYFGYEIPCVNKELDLLKITDMYVIDIELKSKNVGEEAIKRQLVKNHFYLKLIPKKEVHCFTFVSEKDGSTSLFSLENGELKPAEAKVLKDYCSDISDDNIDLEKVFEPRNVLVSPFNDYTRFLNGEYFLTSSQQDQEDHILKLLGDSQSCYFIGLTGGAGSGKTLVLYDMARKLEEIGKRVLIIHCGKLNDGQRSLKEKSRLSIQAISEVTSEFNLDGYEFLFVDEAQRIWSSQRDFLVSLCHNKISCVFSYDPLQCLSYYERNSSNSVETIEKLCQGHIFKINSIVRLNPELKIFIDLLFCPTSRGRNHQTRFNRVHIIYKSTKDSAVQCCKDLEKEGYVHIGLTPSTLNQSSLDYQSYDDEKSVHHVIGQEFDKVSMIMDRHFYYFKGRLRAEVHDNGSYLIASMLYEGLTRAREEIAIVVTDKELMKGILSIFRQNEEDEKK